jgi:hypothetical protein
MRLNIDLRLKRLDERLPRPVPKIRHLYRTTGEESGRIVWTSISEGASLAGKVVLSWRAEDPDAAEKAAAYDELLASGKSVEALHLRVVYTRTEEDELKLTRNSAPDAPRIALGPRSAPGEGKGAGNSPVAAQDGELAQLTAERARLEDRIVQLLVEKGAPNRPS